jgi:hypothetical protein
VMSRLHRGRGKLRQKLAAYAPKRGLAALTGFPPPAPHSAS